MLPLHSGWRDRSFVLLTKFDPAFGEIVRRHFYEHAVTGENADPVLLHLARAVGENFVPIVESNLEAGFGKHLEDSPLEFDQIRFGHSLPLFNC